MECRRCGAQNSDDAAYCTACGQSTTERGNDTVEADSAPQAISRPAKPKISYAGFWLRLFAYIIDAFILSFFGGVFILGPLMQRAGLSPQHPWVMLTSESRQVLAINLLMVMAQWCYFALLESSVWQASVGKKILGIYVTDMTGKRITFARATGHYFATIISTLTFGIGYLMALFTPKKQMLHDMIAECLVLKKTSYRP
ncbi:MAG: RDD family protein [Candidatus Acidiferrales bacterium]